MTVTLPPDFSLYRLLDLCASGSIFIEIRYVLDHLSEQIEQDIIARRLHTDICAGFQSLDNLDYPSETVSRSSRELPA